MDHHRVHRFGNRNFYRSNYAQPPNSRPTIEERLHAQGISTSSNSSWTFSNSHSDIPKKKKGRLWGLFLMVAVFVVLLAVMAIGGLAFYLGAVRVDNVKQELVFDGSLRVTYGDQYQSTLANRSSKVYREKATRYTNMLTNVFQRSVVGNALDEVNILKFENGSLVVHFRMSLDRRKLPNSVTSVEEVLKNILLQEISSVKPVAFRNLQVDHQNLYIKRYLGDPESTQESQNLKSELIPETKEPTSAKTVEVKNGVIRKVPHTSGQDTKSHAKQQHNKTSSVPEGTIIGISEKMQNLSDTLKKRQEESSPKPALSTTPLDHEIKSVEFRKETDFVNGSESQSDANGPTDAADQMEVHSRVTDDLELANKEMTRDRVISSTMNGHARPPFEVRLGDDVFYRPAQVPGSPGLASSDYDEPWRPIIPPPREHVVSEDPRPDVYDELVLAESPTGEVAPITFSRESYEENLRISPEYSDGEKLTRLTEEIAKKYEELMKSPKASEEEDFRVVPVTVSGEDLSTPSEKAKEPENESGEATPVSYGSSFPLGLDQIISGISVVGTGIDGATSEPVAQVTTPEGTTRKEIKISETTTDSVANITVKNPFRDGEDSRSAAAFSFGLPDFPILKQFHHLDSLLKSFSSDSSTEDLTRDATYVNRTAATRFPVRTKPTSDKPEETIYVAVSTIGPENVTTQKSETYRTPVVIKGEVQVLDTKNFRSSAASTEPPKLITLLPVRSNVKGPLRPRPKATDSGGSSESRKSRMNSEFKPNASSFPRILYSIPQKHHFVDDKDGKRWVYYSSSKLLTTSPVPAKTEKLFIVTPEPEREGGTSTREIVQETTTDFPGTESLIDAEGREDPESDRETGGTVTKTSELINRIVNIMENVVISTGNSTKVILKVNQTIINGTGKGKANETAGSDPKFIISNKAVSPHYKLNQAGLPILTKILNKAPGHEKEEGKAEPEASEVVANSLEAECDNGSISCGNGTCLPLAAKCNQQVDCPNAEDEKNCTCAEYLRTQHLNRKLCDGVVDCWDFSDEFDCDWCRSKDYLCSNSKICIKKSQICDGVNNCPFGDDERYCVTVSPNEREANSFNYHPNGYLMVRKHGEWGKLCIDNFDSVSTKSKTGWKISDLGRSVCKALTFRDFEKVERTVSVPNEGRSVGSSEAERYYELSYNDVTSLEESSTRDSTLSFHKTDCSRKEVVKVTCTELECGLRPQATNQWSRIVGGGNANPGSWPWQAALYKEGEFQCGATLISGQWLVSAGHCFYHNQDEYWVARLGTLRTTSSLPSPYEQLRQISKIILHPHYVDTGFINDISLLKMAEPVTFTDYVRPICLPKPNAKIVDGMMCTVVGWGQLFEIGRIFPDTLQEVQLPIISSTECRKRTVFLPLYKITDDMFCAGYDRGGRDACLGDSGGPLMCQESDGKWSLYGVTSNGYGCARSNRPGVYTKVSRYLNWVQSQMHLHSEDEILSQSSLKQLSISSLDDPVHGNTTSGRDKSTEALIKLIAGRVSNVKFNVGTSKKKDKCKGHRCPLGECLSKSRLCNGFIECSDGSDEKDCW